MSDTIELLEAIGSNASLRWASPDALKRALDGFDASEGVRVAAASGDKGALLQELGGRASPPPSQSPTTGGCDEGEDGDAGDDHPGHGGDNDTGEGEHES
ncbi:hypothetical protein [Dyella sp. A6]|uniref:hypothetical protein n=1 Tax=Dyella aluminiiresistens TaxID=3069105 RepID=UPI002E787C47|nr:hypothetical protein [Dyella sp. A6]